MSNRKIGQVSFNLKDPFEKELLDYSNTFPNFSGFVKRLIQNALYSTQKNAQTALPPTQDFMPEQPPNTSEMTTVIMKQFL